MTSSVCRYCGEPLLPHVGPGRPSVLHPGCRQDDRKKYWANRRAEKRTGNQRKVAAAEFTPTTNAADQLTLAGGTVRDLRSLLTWFIEDVDRRDDADELAGYEGIYTRRQRDDARILLHDLC